MKTRYSLSNLLISTASLAGLWCSTAQATIFNFNDEYLIRSGTAFSSVFPGATGSSSGGIYQETNTSSPTITRLAGVTSSIPGEYEQNTPTNATHFLSLNGWGQSLNFGQQVASVYNLGNPFNGAIYFQYRVGTTSGSGAGGTLTPITFNSFDLRGAATGANLRFTLQGYLGGSLVDSAILDVIGNTLTTFTENWTNIDTVEMVSTQTLPVNWGSGTLDMDNIRINDPVPVPEPATLALLGIGIAGLGFSRRRLGV